MLGLGTTINRGGFVASESFLLDDYSGAAAAYSLRKLSGTYSGNAVKVRRASDNAELDIGFSGGELDTSAIATHCGSSDGFVSVWYDQSSNSKNATQTTASNQPKIYDGTTGIITENGKPAVDFNGASNVLVAGNIITTTNAAFSVVGSSDVTSGNNGLFTALDASNDGYEIRLTSNALLWAVNSKDITKPITQFSQFLAFANHDGVTSGFSIDGNNSTTSATQSVSITANLKIGQRTSEYWNGKIQEAIAFDEDKSSNRTDIEDNINTFYDIY